MIYFVLIDRFSDGNENGYRDNAGGLVTTGTTPLFTPAANGNAVGNPADAQRWREAGNTFVGGTLEGARTKLGYLQRLGVTALWSG